MTGCVPVIKALLDEKSDVCHVNKHGQNVLHLCATESQLWTLNYLYHYIRTENGTDKATEMLQVRLSFCACSVMAMFCCLYEL